MSTQTYVGQELDIFSHAINWKRYWASVIRRFVKGDVLEVGAGLGVNTLFLDPGEKTSWTCLEPDPKLAERLQEFVAREPALARCRTAVGTIRSFERESQYDCVLYIDVLEHIEEDRAELAYSADLLRPGGSLIVLSPAHQWLYTPFDRSIGHVRRYSSTTLAKCGPQSCQRELLVYLDSCGMLASLGNKLLLQQSTPSLKQILFWDRHLVPPSGVLDKLLCHKVGKSVLAVWIKRGE